MHGDPASVTDDTQMMLAVGEALLAAGDPTPESFEPLLRQAFLDWAISPDNNRAPGEAWLGDLWERPAVEISPDEPVAVLGRAAASSGDSDSIACLAGGFAGAALGLAAWPPSWQEQIEYADRLHVLAAAWDQG